MNASGTSTPPDLAHAIARSFTTLAEAVRTAVFTLPYPTDVQHTLDRVALECLRRGIPTPAGLPALVHAFTSGTENGYPEPLAAMPPGLVPPAPALIDARTSLPSRTCWELASPGRHPWGSAPYGDSMRMLFESSPAVELDRCLDLLAKHVVLDSAAQRALSGDPDANRAWDRVKFAYRTKIPDAYLTREMGKATLACCPSCQFPAFRAGQSTWLCETGYCPPTAHPRFVSDAVGVLPTALRLFLALPGRAAQLVRRRLHRADIGTTPTTEPGTYRFTTPDGRSGTLRVVDREQPRLLADELGDVLGRSPERCVTVIPDRVITRNPEFLTCLDAYLPSDVAHTLTPESGLGAAFGLPTSESEEAIRDA